jgi:hypothetical protein
MIGLEDEGFGETIIWFQNRLQENLNLLKKNGVEIDNKFLMGKYDYSFQFCPLCGVNLHDE